MTQIQQQPQKCKVLYKGTTHKGEILNQILDKIQVKILDSTGNHLKTDWFEKKEVKRLW
jgi:hypothetical protein